MALPVFKLEEYLGEWEFKAPYILCASDAQSWSLNEILAFADSECLGLWEKLGLSYTEVRGLPLLCEEIANLYAGLSAKNIVCLAGAEDGILCASQALLSRGDHAIVVTPCYQSLEELPKHAAADVTCLRLLEDDGWELDLAKVEAAIQANTKMIFVNHPHNPTGMRLGKQKLDGLITLARRHGIIIFSDEVYRLLGPAPVDPEPPVASIYELGISLGVMSKAYGLAGLRVGWVASQNTELLRKIELVKHYSSICNSAPSEVLSLIALRAQEIILARNNGIVQDNIALLDAFFEQRSSHFSWVRPSGGCTGFVRYKGSDGTEHFCEQLIADKGVLLLPGRVYNGHDSHFRIGFGRKNMPEALARLEQFVGRK